MSPVLTAKKNLRKKDFDWLQRNKNYYLSYKISVKTKALSLVYLNPDHQALIDRIMGLHERGWIPRRIAEHLNAVGLNSWTGKQFYPELVFGIIRKSKISAARRLDSTFIETVSVKLEDR